MFHIKPVQEKNAAPSILAAYKDIQEVFGIEFVPLMFQYIANYEEYFFYMWERMKANIKTSSFRSSCSQTDAFAAQALAEIYTPSKALKQFVQNLHPLEQQHISQTVQLLESANTELMLLTIGVRESVKGILIGAQRLPQYGQQATGNFDDFLRKEAASIAEKKAGNQATFMLSPLFGSTAIAVAKYPDFFDRVASEMDELMKTELYLTKRLGLEQIGLVSIDKFTHSLGSSYQKLVQLAGGKPYFDELLYLLSDTFPSQFPRLVLTTALMRKVLQRPFAAITSTIQYKSKFDNKAVL